MRLLAPLTLLTAAVSVHAQQFAAYTEPTSSVQYNIAIPEAAAAPFDVYVSIVVPANNTWAAIAFGACMLRSPLLVAYKNATSVVVKPFWATQYSPPALYNGSTVAIYNTSTVNSTAWTANFLCKGCSTWLGGSVNAFGSTTFGFGVSSHPVVSTTTIPYHNIGKGHFEVNITSGRNSQSQFDALTHQG